MGLVVPTSLLHPSSRALGGNRWLQLTIAAASAKLPCQMISMLFFSLNWEEPIRDVDRFAGERRQTALAPWIIRWDVKASSDTLRPAALGSDLDIRGQAGCRCARSGTGRPASAVPA